MSDEPSDTTTTDDEQAETLLADAVKAQEADTSGDQPADDARVKKANQEAASYRKQLRTAQAELEKIKQASMSEQEKAVAEAEARGKAAALEASSKRLARAEFRAEAKGKVPDEALDGFLEFADMGKFVGDDGEPDAKAIQSAVKKLAGSGRRTDFDGGARTTAKSTDMNQLIRQAAGL